MRRIVPIAMATLAAAQEPAVDAEAARPWPRLVTAATRDDPAALARLQHPGTVLFVDRFDDAQALDGWFERNGEKDGNVAIDTDPAHVRTGKGALRLTSVANGGRSSGASVVRWLGDDGHDALHLRYWIRYAPDYDQGNLNHTGGSLSGVAGTDKWKGMGTAGLRPAGDDHFSTRVEGWRDWQRTPAPGWLFCYAYWMDMKRDRDGHFWGNMMGPDEKERCVPPRDRWLCVEQRVRVNAPGKADGELAVWLDGRLYLHYQGFRWRSTDTVRLKRAALMVYVHEARRDNTVFYDDVAVSTGYIGTGDVEVSR
ncbi:MAG: hypothetical protein U1E73_06965 [Planctomycetota bacterium]